MNDLRISSLARSVAILDSPLDVADPLQVLLQLYLTELSAFDDAPAASERDWDRIALDTWVSTQAEIIRSKPPVTTTAGALLALDHVLQSEELFAEKSESAQLQMLWHLVKAARDYIASSARSK
jgi:hypothetical protein